jgi:hypothetical protein
MSYVIAARQPSVAGRIDKLYKTVGAFPSVTQ